MEVRKQSNTTAEEEPQINDYPN